MKKLFATKIMSLVSAASLCSVGLLPLFGCGKNSKELLVSYSFESVDDSLTLNGASGSKDKVNYVFNEENQNKIYKPSSLPLLKKGVKDNSLYMDGFSVNVENKDFKMPKKEVTMSAWVAPRVFEDLGEYTSGDKDTKHAAEGYKRLTTVIGQSSLALAEGFSFGYGSQGLWGVEFAITNEAGNDVVWGFYDPVNVLNLYEWTHIAASIDLESGYLSLAYNGKIAYETIIPEMAYSTFVGSKEAPLYIGFTEGQNEENGVNTQMVAGLIDEVRIYEKAFTPPQMQGLYSECLEENKHPSLDWKEVAIDSSQYEGDRYRPQFHAIPPGVWMNEPHAPFFYNNKYHVFYQHNPAGPRFTGSMMRWGHIVSDDMIHWQYVKDAVVPKGVCEKGVWTGGAVIVDNVPYLLLTAGSIPGNSGSGQNVAYAYPKDLNDPFLTEWIVEDKVAIAQAPDHTQGQVGEFRDSTCFKEGDTYYLMVSSSNPNAGGAIPMFTSKDMRQWEYRGYLYENANADLGIHWECTLMLPIQNQSGSIQKYILMMIPQFPESSKTSINTYFWIGTFDKLTCRFIPDEEYKDTLHKFDLGDGHFNGQTGFVDPKTGRTIIYGILQGTDAESTVNAGWVHNFTFPVQIYLTDDGKDVIRKPIDEIEKLTSEIFKLEQPANAKTLNEKIKDIKGDMLRIDATFTIQGNGATYNGGIAVRYNPYSNDKISEQTKIVFGSNGVYVDRSKSSVTEGVEKSDTHVWNNIKNSYDITILLDRSALEVYIDGVISFTTRIYPHYGDSDHIKIFEDNSALNFTKFTVYSVKSAYKDSVTPPYYGNTALLQEVNK